ncbi:MAG: RluA family pseudouridine synthase [Candidatus Melainabacteria bacterium]|nr:RluA family pseudouridine synthase [Candidatus Melainabacteria bacterium]
MVFHKQKTLNVSYEYAGERLDRFICKSLGDLSRTLVQRLIDENLILVNEKSIKAGYKIRANDKVSISIPDLKEAEIESEKIPLDIVFEDKDLIVINKPQGMVTHPADNVHSGTLVNALLYHCKSSLSGINGVLRPGIVHRLDKETSGLIIVCKNDKSHNEIAKQIEERKVKRHYLAIVHGKVQHDLGTVNKPIGRNKIHRHKMAIVLGGRKAITHWKVLKKSEKFTLLECSLETGRTHQIRVHMASLRHPIIGDKTYGKKNDTVEKMMLHAYKLIFIHPKTKKEIKLETEMPERFTQFLSRDHMKLIL